MADNFDLDFGDFSPDYDLNYDFSNKQSGAGTSGTKKKKGEAIREFASGLWDGAVGGFTSYGMPTKLIKSIIPRSYGPAMDAVDRTLRFKDDLYDKVREETKDSVFEFRELTKEAMRIYGAKIPEKVAKRLETWANSNSTDSWRDYASADDGDSLDTEANTDDLLEAMTQGTAANAQLAQAQHQEMMAALAAGAVANQKDASKQLVLLDQILTMNRRLVGFNETMTSTYQRRSLELQFRHYKLDVSVAKMQERYFKRSLEAFSSLITNTAMTDMERGAKSADHQKLLRKMYGTGRLGQTVSRYGNHLMDSMYNIVGDMASNQNFKWAGAAQGAAAGIRAIQQARMSGLTGGARGKGMMLGGALASAAPFLLQQMIRNRAEKNGRANGLGHNLSYYAESAPGLINSWLRNRQNLDEHFDEFDPNNKWYTRLQKGVVNPLVNNALFNLPITQGNKTRVNTPGIKDLIQPAQWDMMSRRSLVEVIPGLLTQSLTVQQKLLSAWTGEEVKETAFNHKQGAFTSKARVKADIRSSVFNRSEFQSAASSFTGMVEAIDPEEELSANARVALAMRFARDADAGDGFNINNYLSNTGWVNTDPDTIKEIGEFLHSRFKTKEATGHAKKLGKFQIGDDSEVAELRKRVANYMQSQQNYMPNVQDSVNALANGGQRAMLKEMGIIQRVNGQEVFNHDMYWQMMQKFIENPNYRIDLEENGKPPDITSRLDTGAITDLVDRAKGGAKDKLNDLASSDAVTDAKDKVNDLLNRGKTGVSETTRRLRASMTRDALNKLYDSAIDRYDDLVTQLQALARSGKDVDIEAGLNEVKRRAKQATDHIREQLKELSPEDMGEEAYNAAKAQGEQILASLEQQMAQLDLDKLRSGVSTQLGDAAGSVTDIVDTVQNVTRSNARTAGSAPKPAPGPKGAPSKEDLQTSLASESNELMRELIAVSASARDQISATKDATIASITGDPAALNQGTEERKGWLKSLGKRMDARSAQSAMQNLPATMLRLYMKGVWGLSKWSVIGPPILAWKTGKALWKYFKRKKDKEVVGDTDGDGVRENSWIDRLRRKKEKPEKQKTDENGVPKDKPTSIFGLLAGIWTGVSGIFGGLTKFGILGGLAKFLKMDWLKTLGGMFMGLFKGKEALDTGNDLMDNVGELFSGDDDDDDGGDDGDEREERRRRRRPRNKRERRAAARERLRRMRSGARNRKRGWLNRAARWTVKKGAKLIAGEPGRMAGRAGWLLNGGAKTLARRIPIIGSLAVGGYEAYQSFKQDDGQGIAEGLGGAAGGALGGWAMGAAIGSVVPVVGTAIGSVIGAGIGALMGSSLGASIYKWAKSPGLLQQMRLYQYGLDTIKGDYNQKIFALETALEKYVKITDSGKATLDPRLPMAELAKPFIEDENSRDEVQAFGGWFVQRFKPVYLTHLAVAKQLFPSTPFQEIDDSKDNAAKFEMGKRCQDFDPTIDHPYRWTGMLFNTQPATNYDVTVQNVKEIIEKLKAEVKDQRKDAKSTSVITTGDDSNARTKAIDKGIVDAIKPANGGKLKGVNLEGTTEKIGAFGQEITTVSVQDVLGSILPKKGEPLDDFTAARMKIYGLPNLDINKVSVLLQLELVMQNRIAFTGRGVQFSGKTKDVFDIMASAFGHNFLARMSFGSWSRWFSRRFLPAYLGFAGAVYNQTGDKEPTLSSKDLPPETKLMLINTMTSQTYKEDKAEANVWTVADSPWSDLDVSNTDASIMDVHINNLKMIAKQAQYDARPVKGGVKQSADGTTDKEWRPDKSTGKQASNAVRGSDGMVHSSTRQETLYDPKTGQTTSGYGAGPLGSGTGNNGQLDDTGKVEPLKMGPGTEEGVRAMLREAAKNGITDKKELAIMLANTHHETGGFKNVEENLRYKAPTLMKLWPKRFPTMERASQVASGGPVVVANTIYGNRMGNNEPGDGYKYRGRGFIQLTGKDNYMRASKALGVNLVDDPDQVAEDPNMAASSALYFWKSNKSIGERAKAGDVAGVRKLINGGTIGLDDTQKLAAQYANMLNSGEYDEILSGKDKGETGTTSDGGSTMQEMMGQSAEEQAKSNGDAPKEGAAPDGSTPVTGKTAAERTAPELVNNAPPGSTTNAGPATPPTMTSTTGPSAAAATNAQSVTPNAANANASAESNPPDELNKSQMQSQSSSSSASSAPLPPIKVALDGEQPHAKAAADNTAAMAEKMDKMIEALNKIAGTNEQMANQEATPGSQQATPAGVQQSAQQLSQSLPNGAGNQNVSFKKTY